MGSIIGLLESGKHQSIYANYPTYADVCCRSFDEPNKAKHEMPLRPKMTAQMLNKIEGPGAFREVSYIESQRPGSTGHIKKINAGLEKWVGVSCLTWIRIRSWGCFLCLPSHLAPPCLFKTRNNFHTCPSNCIAFRLLHYL